MKGLTLSVIILSNTNCNAIYEMNVNCLLSLAESELWQDFSYEVILMESNGSTQYRYDNISNSSGGGIRVIKPREQFNFHHFFNIGLSESRGQFIAFCNNDIIFEHNWFSEILKVASAHKRFQCFSPLDDKYPKMKSLKEKGGEFYKGWNYGEFFAPWCFVWKRDVFNTIGLFDETFDFYAADADETNTLRRNAIYSVLCTKSIVRHISSQTISRERETKSHEKLDKECYPLTPNQIKRGMQWLWDDERYYTAYMKEIGKWGNIRMLHRIQKIVTMFPFLNVRPITKLLYSKNFNYFMCFICGIKE